MAEDLLTGVLVSLAGWLGVLLARMLIMRISKMRSEELQGLVARLVRAAAQSIPDKAERYAWVVARLTKRCRWISAELVEEFIEAAVFALKRELGPSDGHKEPMPLNDTPESVDKKVDSLIDEAVERGKESVGDAVAKLEGELQCDAAISVPSGTVEVTTTDGKTVVIPDSIHL